MRSTGHVIGLCGMCRTITIARINYLEHLGDKGGEAEAEQQSRTTVESYI